MKKKEKELLYSIFKFADKKAHSIMTDRLDIAWLDLEFSKDEIISTITRSNHSYYPVCKLSMDNIIGIISAKALLTGMYKENFKLEDYMTPPLYIPDNINALKILDKFRENKIYLAIIIDEYGSVQGMLTLHDLIENVFGRLPDIYEETEPMITVREDGSILMDGSISIYDLAEYLQLDMDLFSDGDYTTLAGLLLFKFKNIPKSGNSITIEKYKFEVVDMDGNRIDKVLVSKLEQIT